LLRKDGDFLDGVDGVDCLDSGLIGVLFDDELLPKMSIPLYMSKEESLGEGAFAFIIGYIDKKMLNKHKRK
jgi:hypothetical protein